MILAIRTDKPEAELHLLNKSGGKVDYYQWAADRALADTLLVKIDQLLQKNKINFEQLRGVIVYSGSGSFTGLRIGTTVANAIAYSLQIPVAKNSGDDWLDGAVKLLMGIKCGNFVVPDYSHQPNITKPKQG